MKGGEVLGAGCVAAVVMPRSAIGLGWTCLDTPELGWTAKGWRGGGVGRRAGVGSAPRWPGRISSTLRRSKRTWVSPSPAASCPYSPFGFGRCGVWVPARGIAEEVRDQRSDVRFRTEVLTANARRAESRATGGGRAPKEGAARRRPYDGGNGAGGPPALPLTGGEF